MASPDDRPPSDGKRKLVSIASLTDEGAQPILTLETEALGTLTFKPIKVKDIAAVQSWASEVGPEEFLSRLIARLGSRDPDETPLAPSDVENLTATERAEFAARFIERQTDPKKFPREPSEPDAEYIARVIPQGIRQDTANFAHAMGLSRSMAGGLLSANTHASARVTEALTQARAMGLVPSVLAERSTLPPISIPPNPTVRTNKILLEVSERIGQMSTVAVRTAEMQQTLNDYAANAIGVFGEAAEKTNRSANQALRIALMGLGIALVGIVASILIAFAQDRAANAREVAAAKKAEPAAAADRLLRQRENEALNRSAAAIELQNALIAKSGGKRR